MALKIKFAKALAASALCAPLSYADTDCVYKVEKIYISVEADKTVYVYLMDAQGNRKGSISKNATLISDELLSRFHAHVVSAKLSDQNISVRFPEAGLDCSAHLGPVRSDFRGVWIDGP